MLRGAAIALAAVFVMACGGGGDNTGLLSGRDAAPTTTTSSGDDDKPSRGPAATSPQTGSAPAAAATTAPASGNTSAAGSQAFSASAADGTKMPGSIAPGSGTKRKLVVFALMDFEVPEWAAFIKEFAGNGVATLTVTMPQYMTATGGGARPDSKMLGDFESMLKEVDTKGYPNLYLVAEDYHVKAAVTIAGKRTLAGLIFVSPSFPASFDLSPLGKMKGPKLFVAGESTRNSAAIGQLLVASADPKEVKVVSGQDLIFNDQRASQSRQMSQLLGGPAGPAVRKLIKDTIAK